MRYLAVYRVRVWRRAGGERAKKGRSQSDRTGRLKGEGLTRLKPEEDAEE